MFEPCRSINPWYTKTVKNIFVYGTLQNDEIIKALTGKVFKKIPYTLSGYDIFKVKGLYYPGMIASKNGKTKGFILKNLDDKSFSIIDKWEDDTYDRVVIDLASGLKFVTYIWSKPELLEGLWSNDEFRRTNMKQCAEKWIPKELSADV